MSLDPQVKAFLEQTAAAGLPAYPTMSPAEAREVMLVRSAPFLANPPQLANVEERYIPGPAGQLRLRVYTPEGPGPFPTLVYFHGGGWVVGSLDSHDSLCRALANASGCVVAAVEYRLAPENKFPAQVEDAYAATAWLAEHGAGVGGEGRPIAVGGDSAGGAMAAAVCIAARDRGGPAISCQLLIYPVTDFSFDTLSYQENATGYNLTRADMIWFWGHYLESEVDGRHPLASPLPAEDLTGLPPAIVVTAEYDPLRDEGEAYARRLAEAGVAVWFRRYEGMIHNFVRMFPVLEGGKTAVEDIGRELRTLLGAQGATPRPADHSE